MAYIKRCMAVLAAAALLLQLAGCAEVPAGPETGTGTGIETGTGTEASVEAEPEQEPEQEAETEPEQEPETEPEAEAEEEPEPLSGEAVKDLQEALKVAGYYTPLDGDLGPATQEQVMAFQADNGLEATGLPDAATLALLEGIMQESLAPDFGTVKVLINKDYYLPRDYEPEDLRLVEARTTKEVQLVEEAAEAAEAMLAAAEADAHIIFIVSGYRSYDYQENLFKRRVAAYGFEEAEKVVALPGESEHQTGLAMDISTEAMGYGLGQSFDRDPAFAWMQDNAADYGFILRYRQGKEDVTGYIYEPWHYRYIGDPEAARAMMAQGIVYEEYRQQN